MTPIVIAGIVTAIVVIIVGIVLLVVFLKRRNSTPDCVPDCKNKCGGVDDGCGGKCLGCLNGKQCKDDKTCGLRPPCVPDCVNKCGEVWDGCVTRGVKGKCPKDCGPDQTCSFSNCFTNPKDPKKAGCTTNSDCKEYASQGFDFCNKLTNPSSCVSTTKCDEVNKCPDINKPYCSNIGECVSSPCEAMLGKGNWMEYDNRCLPKCSSGSIKRTNTGWCMELKQEDCRPGWLLTDLGGGVKACVPVIDTPFKWIDEDGVETLKNEPQCENTSRGRKEKWCAFNEDEDSSCSNGYGRIDDFCIPVHR